MDINRDDRIRMERAHVHAWPASRTAVIDGWLWRCGGGGSQRANSVSTIDFTGDDLETAIDTVEAQYRALGVPPRFQTFDETSPPAMPAALRARGYQAGEVTLTMFMPIAAGPPSYAGLDTPSAEWLAVYLGAITESRRAANQRILDAVPRPRRFFTACRDGAVISTALCVVSHGCAVIECVATRADVRRQGGAQAVLATLRHWAAGQQASLLGLQVVASNTPAVRLYEAMGFTVGATNRFFVRADG